MSGYCPVTASIDRYCDDSLDLAIEAKVEDWIESKSEELEEVIENNVDRWIVERSAEEIRWLLWDIHLHGIQPEASAKLMALAEKAGSIARDAMEEMAFKSITGRIK